MNDHPGYGGETQKIQVIQTAPRAFWGEAAQSLASSEGIANPVFSRDFDIPVDRDWQLGVVVGHSGSGKTSVGSRLWGGGYIWKADDWPANDPIIDAIVPGGTFDEATGALATVGLGNVPSWLRPFRVLSNGEQFRAELARVIAEAPEKVVIDEFSSVVDRQIACIGALAFSKAWRRTKGQAVLLTPHRDVLEWLDPDWVLDTDTGDLMGTRGLWKRPSIDLEIRQTGWSYWEHFKPHHYLQGSGPMAYATAFVGFVDGNPVCHLGMTGHHVGKGVREARACRLVVMPEWQGAGVSMRFLNYLCERELRGEGYIKKPTTTLFHTAHPALCKSLRRDDRWRQISGQLHGLSGQRSNRLLGGTAKFGGHWRVVQGYRYYGQRGVEAAQERRSMLAQQAKAELDQAMAG